jgi:hypothetical protein
MTQRSALAAGALALVAIGLGWGLFVALPRLYAPNPTPAGQIAPPSVSPQEALAKIKATLFYVSADGLRLEGVEREVPFGEGTIEQARRLIEGQLADAPAPHASAIPAGTTLRAIYLTDRGEAFVDLSGAIADAHPGGSLDELFTVYSLVNALTVNLPAVSAVQILVNGKEVDTLAGHVDLRQPLRKNLAWSAPPEEPVAP